MGRKNGCHVVKVIPLPGLDPGRLFIIKFKASKCKYAKVRQTIVQATDEMDAWQEIKRIAARYQ